MVEGDTVPPTADTFTDTPPIDGGHGGNHRVSNVGTSTVKLVGKCAKLAACIDIEQVGPEKFKEGQTHVRLPNTGTHHPPLRHTGLACAGSRHG